MLKLEETTDGILLPVRAIAGARQSKVGGQQNGALKVRVTQIAEKGKANKAIVSTLSKTLGVNKSQIELISGKTSSQKKFLVLGVSLDDLTARIEGLIES